MDVDHLIERHRLRLVEHKRFLDEDSHQDAAVPSHRGTSQDNRGTTHSVRTSVSDRSGSSRHVKETSREAHITSALARAMDASARTDLSDQQLRAIDARTGILHDPIALDDAAGVASSTAMFFGYAGPQEQELFEDKLLAQHLGAAGKYYVKGPPDSMYQRSVWWLSNRDKQIKEHEANKNAAALAACTFRPNTTDLPTPGKSVGRSRTPNGKRQISTRAVSPNDNAAALSHHLIRQQHARQLREEAQQRVAGPDISKWAPKQTVPKEFELGKRNKPIPSLRQPVGLAERHRHEEQQQQRFHSESAAYESTAVDGEFEPEPRPSPIARAPSREVGSQPRHSHSNDRSQQQQQQQADVSPLLEELLRRVEGLEADNQSLRRQLQEQNVTLQSRNRELEIAKNTVRRLTVQGASS
ncbi:Hypothetical protein, putative [Bodo saltans]|uniref:Uncharacterized protein n=1 Tax=Bodo saltans TaxID=75058 RepID=A0A0S4IRV0_BODSA|nr:Hypothetical protein, putative [Bodo saltans]|eukprot:CUG03882.1 Hypothetical protein, putative [Bodo saltans]